MAKDAPDRAARLAEALRANLRRRKTQARAQGEGENPQSPEGDAPPPLPSA